MSKEIEAILKEKVDPVLAEHFGGAVLTKFVDGVAYVKMTGACASCPSAQSTVEDVVKDILMSESKEVKDVVLDTTVSEDLIDMARKILNKELQDKLLVSKGCISDKGCPDCPIKREGVLYYVDDRCAVY